MNEQIYPGVSDRVKAIVVDAFTMLLAMFAIAYGFSLFESVPDNARMFAFVFVFFLYDPLFTSFFGGTIGHMIIGIRVKRLFDESRNIALPMAMVRYVVKALLGWVSLITVMRSERRRAIHDHLADSVVIYASSMDEA